MPYAWHDTSPTDRRLMIWPHRSLPVTGFVWVMGLTALGLALPMLAVVGNAVLWGLLPFAVLVGAGLWMAIRVNNRAGQMHELVELTPDRITVTRHDPGRADRQWQANPYWVRLSLRSKPVEDYLTLTDGGREIELGVFLAPKERRALRDDLTRALETLRS
ncbi:DUF2244 domain-containing protein [uncultured Paracoccus sp.]|uniref:DUF2244 domain-containing protein n=1 Tax=uncultured Paracoccus sp. TaxID=189685 RepID=UPI002626A735|nr:DUF2244 domain-containing protein [uncultured Paracoccus sp.]